MRTAEIAHDRLRRVEVEADRRQPRGRPLSEPQFERRQLRIVLEVHIHRRQGRIAAALRIAEVKRALLEVEQCVLANDRMLDVKVLERDDRLRILRHVQAHERIDLPVERPRLGRMDIRLAAGDRPVARRAGQRQLRAIRRRAPERRGARERTLRKRNGVGLVGHVGQVGLKPVVRRVAALPVIGVRELAVIRPADRLPFGLRGRIRPRPHGRRSK